MSQALTQEVPRKAVASFGTSQWGPAFSVGIDTYGSKISKQWNENGAANVFHSCIGLKSVFVVLQSLLGDSGFLLNGNLPQEQHRKQ